MSRMEALRRISLPQAVVAMIPPWGNLFIELMKATALVSLITIGDLTFRASQMNQTTYRTVEIFTIVLVFYLAIASLITLGMRALERLSTRGLARGRAHCCSGTGSIRSDDTRLNSSHSCASRMPVFV